ncbi:DUF167 domain-containing protein [Limisalsivibrio acetivorans]|uniref:DUF167 domain-containing protein n=1 Tax=Limisalsivibrio acetivorans TaxID=1304888 RepID=UPI0003B4E85F|nr:DUF167 domain-containing protein [Limisalsivibrio acetivorans]
MRISIYVQPGSKKNGYVGEFDGVPKIKIAAPPVEGAANKAVIKYVSKTLGLSKSSVSIVSGAMSRYKTIEIEADMKPEEVLSILRGREG